MCASDVALALFVACSFISVVVVSIALRLCFCLRIKGKLTSRARAKRMGKPLTSHRRIVHGTHFATSMHILGARDLEAGVALALFASHSIQARPVVAVANFLPSTVAEFSVTLLSLYLVALS